MALSPMDIHNKEFNTKLRGYDPDEVDDFLSLLVREFENVYRDTNEMRERVGFLEQQLEQFKMMENTLRETMITAQQNAKELVMAAHKRADSIVREAQDKKRRIVENATQSIFDLQREYELMKQRIRENQIKYRSLLEGQLRMLNEMAVKQLEAPGSAQGSTRMISGNTISMDEMQRPMEMPRREEAAVNMSRNEPAEQPEIDDFQKMFENMNDTIKDIMDSVDGDTPKADENQNGRRRGSRDEQNDRHQQTADYNQRDEPAAIEEKPAGDSFFHRDEYRDDREERRPSRTQNEDSYDRGSYREQPREEYFQNESSREESSRRQPQRHEDERQYGNPRQAEEPQRRRRSPADESFDFRQDDNIRSTGRRLPQNEEPREDAVYFNPAPQERLSSFNDEDEFSARFSSDRDTRDTRPSTRNQPPASQNRRSSGFPEQTGGAVNEMELNLDQLEREALENKNDPFAFTREEFFQRDEEPETPQPQVPQPQAADQRRSTSTGNYRRRSYRRRT